MLKVRRQGSAQDIIYCAYCSRQILYNELYVEEKQAHKCTKCLVDQVVDLRYQLKCSVQAANDGPVLKDVCGSCYFWANGNCHRFPQEVRKKKKFPICGEFKEKKE